MTELQERLLEMFKWFHNFCAKHDLTYYAVGGTLLGAVRHKGFIPWDDDIDLCMPRRDYNTLKQIMNNAVYQSKYVLESPLQKEDYVYPYCKLYDISTTLVENTRFRTKRGIFLDIFPLDGIGNTIEESKKNFKTIDRKNKYIMTKICAISGHRKLYKNLAIVLSRCIPFPSWRGTIKRLIAICESREYDKYIYVANLVGNWHEKEIMKKEWFGVPTEYDFETIRINGVQDADHYLQAMYGNYMHLPPIEKQKSHHDYIELNLEKSYLEG